MKKIGYIALSTISKKDYMSALKLDDYVVHKVSLDQILMQEISEFDALIIQDDENKSVEVVCEILVYVKKYSTVFVWFVSERLSRVNRTIYPRLGIDGLADKECEPDELALLVTNVLNRTTNNSMIHNQHKSNQLVFTPNELSVCISGKKIHLTKLEFRMIELLDRKKREVVTYGEIYQHIWGEPENEHQYRVANLIFHLRKKLGGLSINVRTIRSVGYMLDSYEEGA